MLRPFLSLFLTLAGFFCYSQSSDRIITAGSAMTETVCILAGIDKIVAVDRTSLFPAQVQGLPSIGYRSAIHAEGIISLKPSLVIAEKDYVEDAVITQLASAGVKVVSVKRTYTLEGTKAMIRQIAEAIQKRPEGERLIAGIEKDLNEVQLGVQKLKLPSPRVACVYNRGTSSLDVGGTNTFSSILPFVNASNAVSGIDGYKPLNAEALIAANPDFILFFESGLKSIGGVEGALKIPGVAQTSAGKQKKVIAMDGIKLSNFGPRLGEAVRELAAMIYPELQSPKP